MLTTTDDPVQEGCIRRFTDHTGRWYEDIPEEEYNRPPSELKTEISQLLQDEIDVEMLRRMRDWSREWQEGIDAEFIEKVRALFLEDKYVGEQCLPSVSSR